VAQCPESGLEPSANKPLGGAVAASPSKAISSKTTLTTNSWDSNPVPFDRLKSAVSLGAPIEPRARKHRTRSRAPVGLTVVDVQWGIALSAPVQGATKHHGAADGGKEAR